MIYRNWSLLSSTVVIWGGVATAGLAGVFLFGGKVLTFRSPFLIQSQIARIRLRISPTASLHQRHPCTRFRLFLSVCLLDWWCCEPWIRLMRRWGYSRAVTITSPRFGADSRCDAIELLSALSDSSV
jgi:hypothetical protein